MQEYIIDFPKQLKEASTLVGAIKLGSRTEPIHNIIISGLGGSGFLADCLFDLCNDTIGPCQYVANKGYSLPKFCDKNTLLILVSYSGNTEETVSCFHEAMSKGLKPICVSSGGKLKDLALNAGMDLIM
jgi:glucose/mannose-6-phosphate isomerase